MNYEKKYKKALSWMQSLYNGLHGKTKEEAERYFPELKESDDEKIRNEIIIYIGSKDIDLSIHNRWLAWLEKQGEQKPDDKVDTKFKDGDWIIRSAEGFKHNTYLVTDVKDYYVCEDLKGGRATFTFNDVHKNFKLWDISDAKEGDVLADNYGIYIFDRFDEYDERCFFDKGAYQYSQKVYENEHMLCSVEVHPATQEQRDRLFQAMKEAGYEWDSEKKELKKIEQKPTWSEDERIRKNCIHFLELQKEHHAATFEIEECIDWLKSLKSQNQYDKGFNNGYSAAKYNQWKPSESQLKVLQTAIKDYGFCVEKNVLESLYNDLKTFE